MLSGGPRFDAAWAQLPQKSRDCVSGGKGEKSAHGKVHPSVSREVHERAHHQKIGDQREHARSPFARATVAEQTGHSENPKDENGVLKRPNFPKGPGPLIARPLARSGLNEKSSELDRVVPREVKRV